MPAKHLGARLLKVQDEETNCFLTPNTSGPFRWYLTEEGAEYPDVDGTVVWTRPDLNRAIHGAAMSAQGHRVVCEVDDNYLSPTNQNIFLRINGYDDTGRDAHMRAFASMDAIICSTENLRDIYYKNFMKRAKYCPDLYVAHNHVDPTDWEGRAPIHPHPTGKIRVGWAGSHQHIWDLRLAARALKHAYEMGAEVVLIGLDPADHDPEWKRVLPEYTHIPWLDPDEYHKHYLNLDIGLVPLVMNIHTLGKSDVKCLEYAMSGAAVIAQNNPVYNRFWKHNETCLLANGPKEMVLAVDRLIRDSKLRKGLAEAGKGYVLAERTIQGNLHEWADAIDGTRIA
jgi:glycosyltransferase involved in cell wall biosynthesis